VLEAIRRTPRAAFVPDAYVTRAYDDAPIAIPHHQVITQPSLSARIIAALGLTGAEEVSEVGTVEQARLPHARAVTAGPCVAS